MIAYVRSARFFTMRGSLLSYRGTPDAFEAVRGRGEKASLERFELRDNIVDGQSVGLFHNIQWNCCPTGRVIVADNSAPHVTKYGVWFEGGMPSSPPVVVSNDFGTVPPVVTLLP